MKRLLQLLLVLAPAAASGQAFVAGGVESGAYQDGAAWASALVDAGSKNRVVSEASFGNGLKEHPDYGYADNGYSYRLSALGPRCGRLFCGGVAVAFAGYRSQWDEGVEWKKGNAHYGLAGAVGKDGVRLFVRSLDSQIDADLWLLSSRHGARIRLARYSDGAESMLLQYVVRLGK